MGKVWIHVAHGWGNDATTASPVGVLSPWSHAENSRPPSSPEGEGPSRPIMMLPGLHGPRLAWGCEPPAAHQE